MDTRTDDFFARNFPKRAAPLDTREIGLPPFLIDPTPEPIKPMPRPRAQLAVTVATIAGILAAAVGFVLWVGWICGGVP